MDESLEPDVSTVPSDRPESDASPAARTNDRQVIPDESDFLLGYATVFGYVSYRSRSQGSFYITSLTENLERYADTYVLFLIFFSPHDICKLKMIYEP